MNTKNTAEDTTGTKTTPIGDKVAWTLLAGMMLYLVLLK